MVHRLKKSVFLLIVLPAFLIAQETKKVTKKSNSSAIKEVFYVLKSDESVKQGNYQKLGYKGAILTNGFYKNGLKDSIWTEYTWGGEHKKSEGTYLADKKAGLWNYYNYNGKPEQQYDYDKNELINYVVLKDDQEKKYKVIKGTDTTLTQLDRPPLYFGGSMEISGFINANTHYPNDAKEYNIKGKTYITFYIDANGKAFNHRISTGFDSKYGCDQEALRVVKSLPNNWIPAKLNGENVLVEYTIPVSFMLQ